MAFNNRCIKTSAIQTNLFTVTDTILTYAGGHSRIIFIRFHPLLLLLSSLSNSYSHPSPEKSPSHLQANPKVNIVTKLACTPLPTTQASFKDFKPTQQRPLSHKPQPILAEQRHPSQSHRWSPHLRFPHWFNRVLQQLPHVQATRSRVRCSVYAQQNLTDKQTKTRPFKKCTLHKITHHFASNVVNTDESLLPSDDWYNWKSILHDNQHLHDWHLLY
mmetsp:Transcript_2151/g.3116  ORF Transcript_2151/g.3116 Transcript_2151/m.3116 type:complete len:217 (-) Transcript_2151:807-1457(-)